jgi:beta-lactamase class A
VGISVAIVDVRYHGRPSGIQYKRSAHLDERPAAWFAVVVRSPTLLGVVAVLVALAGCGSDPSGPPAPGATAPAPAPPRSEQRDEARAAAAAVAWRRLERREDARVGVFALDTGDGRTLRHRADRRFPIASVFKAHACGAVLHRARTEEPGLLDRRVRWSAAELLDPSPVTRLHLADGLTVRQLCSAAVRTSDNTAGNLLLREAGGPAGLTRWLRSIGDRRTRLDRTEPELNRWAPGAVRDTTTAEAAARSLGALVLGPAAPAVDRARLRRWLQASTTGRARIRAALPAGWRVAGKTGTGGSLAWGSANEVAVVWPPGRRAPVLLGVLTHGGDAGLPADDALVAAAARIAIRGLGLLDES